ncbi:MFS transporter [Promicromonospora sp. NPDC057488]|uniref:MFS transporter n=1 Tax=Promicromonospora sp. NPDC057488 TaxID=3346147 RepID=UPI00366BE901
MRRAVLVVCVATGFTTLLDSAILTVAAPVLRAELGAGTAQLQWILAGYSLTFGLALVPAGRLGDVVGRRTLLVTGIALFSASSILGATAHDADTLVVTRLLQGVGAGIANPQVIGLMQDHFTGSARARALGAYATAGAFAAVIAPLVGGALLALAGPGTGWRLVVGVNIPFALVVIALALWLVPPGRGRATGAPGVARPGLDLVGLTLITLAVLALLTPFLLQDVPWWQRAAVAAPLLVVVPALLAWERGYARRGRTPVLAPALVRSPGFVLGCLVATCTFGQALGYSAVLMLFLQDGAGLSALAAGLVVTPGALLSGLAGAVSWRLLRRWGRPGVTAVFTVKLVATAGTLAAVLTVPEPALVPVLVASQVLTGVLSGLTASPNQALTLEHAPAGQHGVAAGALQLVQRVSATVCIAALTGAYVLLSASGPGGAGADGGHRAALAVATAVVVGLGAAALAASAADTVVARRRLAH